MRFSIVVPVFNNPSDLSACLRSIAQLNFPKDDFEVIVVDNNSTDDTAEVAHGFGVTVLVEKDVQSSYAARNRGIRAAKGEFIAFTDSDCVVDAQWLAEIDAAVQDGVGCLAGEILSASPATLVERFSDEIGLLRQRGPLSGWHFKPYAQTANAVYRKRVFDEIGGFDPSMQSGGDAAIAWRMQDRTSYTLKFVPSAIVHHHHRASVPELWKQFRRYGTINLSWAFAQPDYTPPAIGRLEADTVAALEKAVAALERAGLDEKELVFPVLQAVTQTAHLSGYLLDLLGTVSRGLPLDEIPQLARKLAPTCNICGSTTFVAGPNNRMAGNRAPQCAECGSLERHRVLAAILDGRGDLNLQGSSAVSFGDWLPSSLAKRFGDARGARAGEQFLQAHDVVVAPTFASFATGRGLTSTIAELVAPLKDDGVLILIDRENKILDIDPGNKIYFNEELESTLSSILPNTNISGQKITDKGTGVIHHCITACAI